MLEYGKDEEFVETLKSLAECPVCVSVPRGGKFYLCQNSHSICESCYKRLGFQQQQQQQQHQGDSTVLNSSSSSSSRPTLSNHHHSNSSRPPWFRPRPRQCPQCRGKFPSQPMKNRTLERLIDEVRFEFPCKYANNGCKTKDVDERLKSHERDCKLRDVQCPKCRGLVPFLHIRQHLLDRHPDIPPCHPVEPGNGSDDVTVCFESWLFGRAALTLSGISVILSMTDFKGQTFCPSIYKTNDHWYIWIYVLAPKKIADSFVSELTIEENGMVMAGPCPVFSVDDTLDDVLGRESTLEMSNRLLSMLVDRAGVTGQERRAGYFGKFNVRFVIKEAEINF